VEPFKKGSTAFLDAHTASRCAVQFFVLSLSLNKERTKENQLKGLMPLRNPQAFFFFISAARVVCLEAWHKRSLSLSLDMLCRVAMPGGFQGERLGVLSWFILCHVAKNEHKNSSANACGAQCERA